MVVEGNEECANCFYIFFTDNKTLRQRIEIAQKKENGEKFWETFFPCERFHYIHYRFVYLFDEQQVQYLWDEYRKFSETKKENVQQSRVNRFQVKDDINLPVDKPIDNDADGLKNMKRKANRGKATVLACCIKKKKLFGKRGYNEYEIIDFISGDDASSNFFNGSLRRRWWSFPLIDERNNPILMSMTKKGKEGEEAGEKVGNEIVKLFNVSPKVCFGRILYYVSNKDSKNPGTRSCHEACKLSEAICELMPALDKKNATKPKKGPTP